MGNYFRLSLKRSQEEEQWGDYAEQERGRNFTIAFRPMSAKTGTIRKKQDCLLLVGNAKFLRFFFFCFIGKTVNFQLLRRSPMVPTAPLPEKRVNEKARNLKKKAAEEVE